MRTAVPYPPPFPQLTSKVHRTMSQSTYRARSVKVHLPSPHPSAKDAAKHPAREGGETRLGRHRNKNGCWTTFVIIVFFMFGYVVLFVFPVHLRMCLLFRTAAGQERGSTPDRRQP